MKAIYFKKFGPSSVLESGDLPRQESLAANEVRIKSSHASVNPVDWKIREGYLQAMLPHQFPIIPGWDVAGTVAEVGSAVKTLKVGDQVFAYGRKDVVQHGTYAEEVVLPEISVALKPRTIPLASAAAVPLTALTAWQALTEGLAIAKGDTVLITAGAGGVGSFAIQFAKHLGAKVVTTGSRPNASYLDELGADFVIDYTSEKLADGIARSGLGPVTKILDGVGGDVLTECYDLLAQGGKLISIVDTPDAERLSQARATGGFHFVYPSAAQLQTIASLIDERKIILPAIVEFSVRDAAAQQDANQARHTRGKVVLRLDF